MRYLSLLLCTLFLLGACQQPEKKQTAVEKKQDAKPASQKRGLEGLKLEEIASTQVIDMTALLSTATKVEFLFYVDPNNPSVNSISTETDNIPQLRKFSQYITNREVKKPDCVYMGSALFKNDDGDILFDGEFNLSQECIHFKMIYEGKTTYRMITPQGLEFLAQFYMMVTQQVQQQMQ